MHAIFAPAVHTLIFGIRVWNEQPLQNAVWIYSLINFFTCYSWAHNKKPVSFKFTRYSQIFPTFIIVSHWLFKHLEITSLTFKIQVKTKLFQMWTMSWGHWHKPREGSCMAMHYMKSEDLYAKECHVEYLVCMCWLGCITNYINSLENVGPNSPLNVCW